MEEKLDYLNTYLLNEIGKDYDVSLSLKDKEILYKTFVNMRTPREVPSEYLTIQDEYLRDKLKKKGIVDISSLDEVEHNIYLYFGDITRINSDLIVNAGNNEGLGCFNPYHNCIDNVIHTSAGLQLRQECNDILKGKLIATGEIIVCNGYNLPCKKVITTVGPQITDKPTKNDEILLSNCYKNTMEYAIKNGYKSITFPSVATGLYAYPIKEAKAIAYNTIKKYTDKYDIKVIFDVFSKEDYDEYRYLFKN